jgi:hypothetical protein
VNLDRITVLTPPSEPDVHVETGTLTTNGTYALVTMPETAAAGASLRGSQIVCSADGSVVYSGDEIVRVHTQFHVNGYRLVCKCRPGDLNHRVRGNPAITP